MTRIVFLLAAVALGAGVVVWILRRPAEPAPRSIAEAFARARAYYLNESNADYRRARIELLGLEDRLSESVAYRLDLALIDLQEANFLVDAEDRVDPVKAYVRLFRSALEHLGHARRLDPGNEAVAYNLARTYIKLAPTSEDPPRMFDEAEGLLVPLAGQRPADPSALLMLADLVSFDRARLGEAEALYRRIIDQGEDFVPRTLYYVAQSKLHGVLQRLGRTEDAKAVQDRIAEEYGADRPTASPGATERGRYTRFLDLVEPAVPERGGQAPQWHDVTSRVGVPPLGSPRFAMNPDLDEDCARDLVVNGATGLRLLRNRRDATFRDLTGESGLPAGFVVAAGAAGDIDGDGLADLVVGGPAGLRVFLNATDPEKPNDWRFREITEALKERATEPVTAACLWDLDHDGDLDLFVGGSPNRVYRLAVEMPATGGRFLVFTEMAGKLGLAEPPAAAALLLDVDDDHDGDLLVTGPLGNAWFENRRQLRFERRPLPAGAGLEAADVDNDGLEEVRIGTTVHEWNGRAFETVAERAALLDLDFDGVVDDDPLRGLPGPVERAFGADLNRDGFPDLVTVTPGGLKVFYQLPQRRPAWIDIRPRGLRTNEFGIGARVRLYAGDLVVGATCRDGILSFGLGARPIVDAVTIRWTNGVEQGVVCPLITSCGTVEERDGEFTSCPFLYAFDGANWHFSSDCHSGRPLGLPVADGVYLPPRPSETVLVPARMLRPHEGRLRLDLADELWELLFLDGVVLRAIDHPAGVRPVLDEGFRITASQPFRVHGLDGLRPPRAARDQNGRDITPLVSARDGRHAVVFEAIDSRYTGIARPWSIELDFGDLSGADRVLLLMDGWVEWPTASSSIAASQADTVGFRPPVLEARAPDGTWALIDEDPGFPGGKGKTALVDITGKAPTGRLRLRSTQRLHWDAFFVATGPDRALRVTELPLARAEHKWRGVGRRVDDPAGEQPWRYRHDDLVSFLPYDQLPAGLLTRYGDVRALLAEVDDRYPVMASGDVIELAFDAARLPPLPDGWVRDWAFTTFGWVKDCDMNQAVRETVGPLPFRAMTRYPYDEAEERHPHPDFVAEWFVRPARRLVDPSALNAVRNPPRPAGLNRQQGTDD